MEENTTTGSEEAGDLHPIELVAHFLLSDSLENLHETFSLLHESQRLLLNRLQALEKKMKSQLELTERRDFDVSLVHGRIKALSKKLTEIRKIFELVESKLRVLEEKAGSGLPSLTI